MTDSPEHRSLPSLSALPGASRVAYLMALAALGPALSPFIGIFNPESGSGSTTWRYGVYGQLAAAQFYVLTAMSLIALIAAARGHKRVLTITGIVAIVLALVLAAGGPFFALDLLQLRRTLSTPGFAPFRTTGFKVVGMALLSTPILAFVAVQCIRSARAITTRTLSRPTGPQTTVGALPRA